MNPPVEIEYEVVREEYTSVYALTLNLLNI